MSGLASALLTQVLTKERENRIKRKTAVLTITLVVLLLAWLVAAYGGPKEETSPPQEEKPAPGTLDGKALV